MYDDNEKLVIVVLELNPSGRIGESTYTNIIKIATAQGRSHIQSLLNNILYVDSNKNRVNQWLNVNRLQLPLRSTTTNSKIIVSNSNENVKFSIREPIEQKKELVAVHNLSEEKMLKSLFLECKQQIRGGYLMKKEKYYLALERLFQNENNCSQKSFILLNYSEKAIVKRK